MPTNESRRSDRNERGSAMLVAVFVLAFVTVSGIVLLFMSFTDLRMGRAALQTKKAFYLAEAGLEDARTTLYNTNLGGDFDDDLEDAAGGTVDDIEFDPANLTVSYASDGTPTLAGFGDDVPLRGITPLGEGWYAAFLTNDPSEVVTETTDGNDKVMITAVGMGPDRSLELVQAILLREEVFPSIPPAAITLLGPAPVFEGATSTPKVYDGEDCGGYGIPGLQVPVVGTIGSDAEASAEAGIHGNPTYQSGPYSREDTFADLTDPTEDTVLSSGYGTIDPAWTDCLAVKEMIETTRAVATFSCSGNSCTLPATTPSSVIFIDGDFDLDGGTNGQGMVLVTGELRVHGGADWQGLLYALGEGQFARYGSGNGTLSGATMVADVAGPDGIYGNTDDCTGGDGGFGSVTYDERGGGNSDTMYCTDDFFFANPVRPYDVVAFRQQ